MSSCYIFIITADFELERDVWNKILVYYSLALQFYTHEASRFFGLFLPFVVFVAINFSFDKGLRLGK